MLDFALVWLTGAACTIMFFEGYFRRLNGSRLSLGSQLALLCLWPAFLVSWFLK